MLNCLLLPSAWIPLIVSSSLFFSSFKSIHEPLCMSTDSISYVHIASAFSRSHHVNSYLSILRYLRKFAHNLFLSFNVQLCCSGHGLRYSTVWFIHYIPLQHIWCVETNFHGFPSFFERTHTHNIAYKSDDERIALCQFRFIITARHHILYAIVALPLIIVKYFTHWVGVLLLTWP